MPLSQNSRSKVSASVKSARSAGGKRAFNAYTFEPPGAAAKNFLVAMPPAGVKITFVAKSRAAETKLKAWAAARMAQADRVVTSEPNRSPETATVPPDLRARIHDDHPAASGRAFRKPAKPKADIETPVYTPGSRARALLRGREIAEADLMEAGGAFTAEEAQKLLNGVTRQALEKRVRDGSLLAVPGPGNRRRYPAMQFTRQGVVRGLAAVQEALPTRDPWTILNFLVRPDERLGGRKPIEVLRGGEVDLVVSAARGMGLQGG